MYCMVEGNTSIGAVKEGIPFSRNYVQAVVACARGVVWVL